MAVYERTYKRYAGPITPQTWRFLVIPHYAFKDIFKSKLLVVFYSLCFIYPLVLSVSIYIRNNLDRLASLIDPRALEQLQVDAGTFQIFLYVQSSLAFFLTLIVGPGLVSRDLGNNGLPLYLCRPISRTEYVGGKMSVLFILGSGITWVPGLALYSLQGILAEGAWWSENLRVAVGMTLGALVWIFFLALLALAFSAWVKWRPVAAFLMFMSFGAGSFFAVMINLLFFNGRDQTEWGFLFDPGRLITIIWAGLLDTRAPDGPPLFMAWVGLAAMCAFLVLLLNKKLQAYEVVR